MPDSNDVYVQYEDLDARVQRCISDAKDAFLGQVVRDIAAHGGHQIECARATQDDPKVFSFPNTHLQFVYCGILFAVRFSSRGVLLTPYSHEVRYHDTGKHKNVLDMFAQINKDMAAGLITEG